MASVGHSFARRARDELAPAFKDINKKKINWVDISISDPIRAATYAKEMEISFNISHVYTVSDGVVTLADLNERRAEILAIFPRIIDIDIMSNDISRFTNQTRMPC